MTLAITPAQQFNTPTIKQLDNGLTIIAEQMPLDSVSLNLWLNVGSALEEDSINGMAHFLEHMVFKGTPNLPSGEFERLIEERGAITNAATSQEYTNYYITCTPQDFPRLAPLQFDVVLNPSIPDEAFERERLVVLEEIRRSQDNPNLRTYYRAMQTCFEQLPYTRPVLGLTEVIEQLQPQQMRDFHYQWYQPQSITAAVVGNLPESELLAIVTDLGERFPHNLTPPRPNLESEAKFSHIVRQEYIDDTLQQARLVMMWRVPGMRQLEETYALDVLAAILGQGKISRLFRQLREERGLVTHIGVSNMTHSMQGVFFISAHLPPENLAVVEDAVAKAIEKLHTEAVATQEINRIRTQVANRFIFGNERPSARAHIYGYYYSQLGDLTPAMTYPQRIQALETTDLQVAAQKYLDPNAYGVVIMRPGK